MSESIDPSEPEPDINDAEIDYLYAERDDLVVERDVLLVSLSVAHTNLAKKEIEIQAISKTLGVEIDTLTSRLQVGWFVSLFGSFSVINTGAVLLYILHTIPFALPHYKYSHTHVYTILLISPSASSRQ